MTTHAHIKSEDRTALPRALLGRRQTYQISWKFEVDQLVMFHDVRAVITGRQMTAMGREIYDIAVDCADRPHRTVMGGALVEVEDSPPARDPGHTIREAGRSLLLLSAPHASCDELARQAAV